MLKIEDSKHYTTSKWKEHDNYTCTQCQFATIDLNKMQAHWDLTARHKHIWAKPKESKEGVSNG